MSARNTRNWKYLLLIPILWILCFDLHRLLFLSFHFHLFQNASLIDVLRVFIESFRLDIATASIVSIFPAILLFLDGFFHSKLILRWIKRIIWIEAILLILIQAGENVAYKEWNHKLTSRVFMHLSHPDEVFRTADGSLTYWFLFFVLLQIVGFYFIQKFIFRYWTESFKIPAVSLKIRQLFFLPVVLFIYLLLLRGGFQQIPLNINSAVFSNSTVVNDLAINPTYYFSKSYLLYKRNILSIYVPKKDSVQADRFVNELYKKDGVSPKLLTNSSPNVVLIILEGWAARAVSAYGNFEQSTPFFDGLLKNGIWFDSIYAANTTSEVGNATIFTGMPALPEVSITLEPERHRKLETINASLKKRGYTSAYRFGGDLKYGNIGGFLLDHGVEKVVDESDFPSKKQRGKLNYFDDDLYEELVKDMNQLKEPFLQCAFTGSTHAPYDQPKSKRKVFKGQEADYMNALVYSDDALKRFITKCKKQKWYKNTLFVFVSDHGHPTPQLTEPNTRAFFHIPLLFYGEPINTENRGKVIHTLGSQADLAATLLNQLNTSTKKYPWSKDLLNPSSKSFAFHSIIRGYGWMNTNGHFTHYMELKMDPENTFPEKIREKERNHCYLYLNALNNFYSNL